MLRIIGRILLGLAVFVFAAALLVVGLGWVGDEPKAGLASVWLFLASFIAAYYELFERIGKILAPFVAVASGGYAIYQKWHYAGRNLHLRLQEFLDREERRLRAADDALNISADRPGPAREFLSPIFSEENLGSVLRKMGWGTPTLTTLHKSRVRRAEEEVERARKEVEDQLALWEKKKSDYQRRLIQAHLVKGAIAASQAAKIRIRGDDDREPNQTALAEFERAMKVDSNCTEPIALEFAAHQRVRLGDYAGAFQDFGMLAQWAEEAGKPLVRARALKYQAEIHEWRNGDQPNVNAATQLLNTAIQTFPTPLGRPEIIEAAELHETQGRVRAKRRNLDWDDGALNSYTNAEGLYHQISGPVAEAALRRIATARSALLARRYAKPTAENGSTSEESSDLTP